MSGRKKPIKLRIIGGQMRGRVIPYHGAKVTRPMKDNVRESVFNILGGSVRGAKCFDMFAGTGAMGFEAVSRGASQAVMVEQDRQAVRFLRKTAESLGLPTDTKTPIPPGQPQVRLIAGDAFHWGRSLLASPLDDTPWIVFLCPPYRLWDTSLDQLRGLVRRALEHAPPGSVVAIETPKSFDPKKIFNGIAGFDQVAGTKKAPIAGSQTGDATPLHGEDDDVLPSDVSPLPSDVSVGQGDCGWIPRQSDWDVRDYGTTRMIFVEPALRCGMN